MGPGAIAARAGKAGIYRERGEKREECLQQPKTKLFKKRRVSGALPLVATLAVTAAGRGTNAAVQRGTRHKALFFFWVC